MNRLKEELFKQINQYYLGLIHYQYSMNNEEEGSIGSYKEQDKYLKNKFLDFINQNYISKDEILELEGFKKQKPIFNGLGETVIIEAQNKKIDEIKQQIINYKNK